MIRLPHCLEEESNRLTEEFFSQYDAEEMKREMSDNEIASWEKEGCIWRTKCRKIYVPVQIS